MTKTEWAEIIKKIRVLFPRSEFMDRKEVFDAWYEELSDLQFPAAMKAVQNYAKENQYPPSIADIRKEYNVMWEAYQAILKDVKQDFDLACSYYPGMDMDLQKEAFEIFRERLKKYPNGEWVHRSRKFRSNTIDFVQDCGRNHKDIPKFKDYINECVI